MNPDNALERLDTIGDGRDHSRVPFAGTYWVIPGLFLAGAHPSHCDRSTVVDRCSALVESGVRLVVNLTTANEHAVGNWSYEDVVSESDAHVVCVREEITDMGIPDRETIDRVLGAIDGAIASGTAIYVHCQAGRGRTGTVVGRWLMLHGYADGDDVFELIGRLRSLMADANMESPETPRQRRFVLEGS